VIAQQTAYDIAMAYREVETAEKMLVAVKEAMDRFNAKDIRDAFGRRQDGLQLGVPSGETGHRLFDVAWPLALPIIEAHITHHRTRIALLSQAAMEQMAAAQAGAV
jgi:hypothetical protein